jgi:hypothetical protein
MSSMRERQRLLMQNNRTDATYLEEENSRRRSQYQQQQQVQHELTGMTSCNCSPHEFHFLFRSTFVYPFIPLT